LLAVKKTHYVPIWNDQFGAKVST